MEKRFFDLESISLHYNRATGNLKQKNAARTVHHVNVEEGAIHFWREALS